MSYGDIVFSPTVLQQLMRDTQPISVAVDRQWRAYWERRFEDPLVDAETLKISADGNLVEIGQKPRGYSVIGRREARKLLAHMDDFRGQAVLTFDKESKGALVCCIPGAPVVRLPAANSSL